MLPNDTQAILSICIAVVDYTGIKSVRESKKWTAQFWAGYMDIIQMVFTLIRATKKTTLNCMSALSVCIVPNVNCKRSQQIRTICTCVTDYTYKFI